MTREEIIRLAESAGITVIGEAVWRLCELVAAAEREACAAICAREARHYGKIPDLGHYQQGRGEGATSIEKKIRARGKNV